MKAKLTNRLSSLLLIGCGTAGSYDPSFALGLVEESMTIAEATAAWEFLGWCHKNGKEFGSGNIKQVWNEWVVSK